MSLAFDADAHQTMPPDDVSTSCCFSLRRDRRQGAVGRMPVLLLRSRHVTPTYQSEMLVMMVILIAIEKRSSAALATAIY